MTVEKRSWYRIAPPVDVNPDWPEAHLYEVLEGIVPPTPLDAAERIEIIKVVRETCAGRRWHRSLEVGYDGRVKVTLGNGKAVNCVFLTIDFMNLMEYQRRSGEVPTV